MRRHGDPAVGASPSAVARPGAGAAVAARRVSAALLLPGSSARLIVGLYAAGVPRRDRRLAVLDAYALLGAVAVTAMLLWPRLYYPHYGAFEGPFLALAVALPAGLLTGLRAGRPAGSRPLPGGPLAASRAAGAVLAAVARRPCSWRRGSGQFRAESAAAPAYRSRRPRTG